MPVCSICSHALAAAINQQILSGVGANTIAVRFDVSLQSVKRHRGAGHVERSIKAFAIAVPEAQAAALGEAAAHNAQTLIAKSATLMTRAEKFLDQAEASGDLNSVGKALIACERSIRLAAELAGAFPKSPSIDARSVTVNTVTGLSTDDLRRLIAHPALNADG